MNRWLVVWSAPVVVLLTLLVLHCGTSPQPPAIAPVQRSVYSGPLGALSLPDGIVAVASLRDAKSRALFENAPSIVPWVREPIEVLNEIRERLLPLEGLASSGPIRVAIVKGADTAEAIVLSMSIVERPTLLASLARGSKEEQSKGGQPESAQPFVNPNRERFTLEGGKGGALEVSIHGDSVLFSEDVALLDAHKNFWPEFLGAQLEADIVLSLSIQNILKAYPDAVDLGAQLTSGHSNLPGRSSSGAGGLKWIDACLLETVSVALKLNLLPEASELEMVWTPKAGTPSHEVAQGLAAKPLRAELLKDVPASSVAFAAIHLATASEPSVDDASCRAMFDSLIGPGKETTAALKAWRYYWAATTGSAVAGLHPVPSEEGLSWSSTVTLEDPKKARLAQDVARALIPTGVNGERETTLGFSLDYQPNAYRIEELQVSTQRIKYSGGPIGALPPPVARHIVEEASIHETVDGKRHLMAGGRAARATLEAVVHRTLGPALKPTASLLRVLAEQPGTLFGLISIDLIGVANRAELGGFNLLQGRFDHAPKQRESVVLSGRAHGGAVTVQVRVPQVQMDGIRNAAVMLAPMLGMLGGD